MQSRFQRDGSPMSPSVDHLVVLLLGTPSP
jgi:hypothetical protein